MGLSRSTLGGSLLLVLFCAGCWGDVKPVYPDGGGDTDTNTGPADPVFYPGGGTGGGPIDGLVNVYIIDEDTGQGLAGARVMLGDDPQTAQTGATDGDGLVIFEEDGLSGPVNLHVLADGYSAESYIGLGAANATLAVRPLDHAAGYGTPALVSGSVSGHDALPEPAEDEYRVLAVYYGLPVAELLDDREPELGRPVGGAVLDLVEDGDEYSIEVPPHAGALYALGGIWRTLGTLTPIDDEYEWTHLGIVTGLDPGPGEAIDGVEIPLDIALLIELNIALQLLPAPYDLKGAALALDLGEDGAVWFLGRQVGSQTSFNAPNLEGDIAEAGVLLVGLGDQDVDEGQEDDPEAITPRARRYEHDEDDFIGYTVGPYVFDTLSTPPAQLGWDGAQFTCLPPSGTSLAVVAIQGAEDGVQAWRATVFGALPDTLPVPDLPADWGWNGAPATGVLARVWIANIDADMDDISFAGYHSLVRDTAETAAVFE